MAFNPRQVAVLLAKCQRRCCICHKFCGVKIETHHIEQSKDDGSDDIENAILLCFECHAEVNHYNDAHPRGRKFTKEELLLHKKQWLEICENHPEALISAPRDVDVGPLEGMSLELEHNEAVVTGIVDATSWQDKIGCVLHDDEYKRSVAQGSLLLLPEDLRIQISGAYSEVGRINTFVNLYANTPPVGEPFAQATNRLLEAYRKSKETISSAVSGLNTFLLQEKGETSR